MMTTLCAILGALPIALGLGAGAELRQPLGLAVVGGLVVSQMLTLFITPVVFLMFDRLGRRWGEKRRPFRELRLSASCKVKRRQLQSFFVANTSRVFRNGGARPTQEALSMMIRNPAAPHSLLLLPEPHRVALGTSIALAMAVCLAGAGTMLALNTSEQHRVVAVGQASHRLATEAPLSLNHAER